MNIALVDDCEADIKKLWLFIQQSCLENHIFSKIDYFNSGESFLRKIRTSSVSYDIIFLDIYMHEMDGLTTATELRKIDSESLLVFCTYSTTHAVQSYRVRAFDYILKPYTYEQLAEVMLLCQKAIIKLARYIEIKEGRTNIKLLLRSIIYTDYNNHYIYIHAKKRIYKCYQSFAEFSKLLLDYPQFISCYRNCIVNMDEVASMEDQDFLLSNGERMPIARNLRLEVRQQYSDYIFSKMEEH